jgi:hypothetical protein
VVRVGCARDRRTLECKARIKQLVDVSFSDADETLMSQQDVPFTTPADLECELELAHALATFYDGRRPLEHEFRDILLPARNAELTTACHDHQVELRGAMDLLGLHIERLRMLYAVPAVYYNFVVPYEYARLENLAIDDARFHDYRDSPAQAAP